MQLDMLSEMDDAGSSMAMDVDDLEAMEKTKKRRREK
jgi:hypothetical protein